MSTRGRQVGKAFLTLLAAPANEGRREPLSHNKRHKVKTSRRTRSSSVEAGGSAAGSVARTAAGLGVLAPGGGVATAFGWSPLLLLKTAMASGLAMILAMRSGLLAFAGMATLAF